MKLSEMINLAKVGYKPNEIKELIELEKTTEFDAEDEEKLQEDEENLQEDKDKDDEEKHPDENEEVKQLKAKMEEQQKLIETLQANNINQNVKKDDKSDEDILTATIRGFM